MLRSLIWLLIVLWLIGLIFGATLHLAGGLIHILLVLALILFIIDFLNGRNRPII